jgi:negative regulator of flagellin synthesis FlgM
MKIDEISKHVGLLSHATGSASRGKAEGDETGKAGSPDGKESAARIELSRASVEYGKIAEAAVAEQKDRIERVSQLREAIEKGQYEIDSSQVADKVILEGIVDALKS